jgi:pimeloyl-ACP methyl ester carboxylesterase
MPALNFERRGGGEPLLLVHGLGGELGVWAPVLDRLAEHRDVIAVDLPGFGATPPLPAGEEPTPAALAASVARLLDELGIDRAHVAGNSLGGWVALELARQGRARSVTALSAAGLWRRPLGPRPGFEVRRLGSALGPLVPLLLRVPALRRLALASTVAHPERVPVRDAIRLVRGYLRAPGFEAANLAMRSAVFTGGAEIDVPVTFAWAELDRLVAPPRAVVVPGERTVVLPGVGHTPTWDDPELVTRVLLAGSASRSADVPAPGTSRTGARRAAGGP